MPSLLRNLGSWQSLCGKIECIRSLKKLLFFTGDMLGLVDDQSISKISIVHRLCVSVIGECHSYGLTIFIPELNCLVFLGHSLS